MNIPLKLFKLAAPVAVVALGLFLAPQAADACGGPVYSSFNHYIQKAGPAITVSGEEITYTVTVEGFYGASYVRDRVPEGLKFKRAQFHGFTGKLGGTGGSGLNAELGINGYGAPRPLTCIEAGTEVWCDGVYMQSGGSYKVDLTFYVEDYAKCKLLKNTAYLVSYSPGNLPSTNSSDDSSSVLTQVLGKHGESCDKHKPKPSPTPDPTPTPKPPHKPKKTSHKPWSWGGSWGSSWENWGGLSSSWGSSWSGWGW